MPFVRRKRRVFKVETVGDCYVAAAGLPHPRADHHIVMARFAQDCMDRFNDLTKKLEVTLGPDTGDLGLRAGLHTGQVTAGVLRGDRARYQIFGDTVNTTARTETTGHRGKIHITQELADLLIASGKESWIMSREQQVFAKGKGMLSTYWLKTNRKTAETVTVQFGDKQSAEQPVLPRSPGLQKQDRLIDWNVDILCKILRELTAKREMLDKYDPFRHPPNSEVKLRELESGSFRLGGSVVDEVQDVIELPPFHPEVEREVRKADSLVLPPEVVEQVKDFVRAGKCPL
jgi:Adenylate and Guanylate cyclase catalytic domain